jgi:hypothetical protein
VLQPSQLPGQGDILSCDRVRGVDLGESGPQTRLLPSQLLSTRDPPIQLCAGLAPGAESDPAWRAVKAGEPVEGQPLLDRVGQTLLIALAVQNHRVLGQPGEQCNRNRGTPGHGPGASVRRDGAPQDERAVLVQIAAGLDHGQRRRRVRLKQNPALSDGLAGVGAHSGRV